MAACALAVDSGCDGMHGRASWKQFVAKRHKGMSFKQGAPATDGLHLASYCRRTWHFRVNINCTGSCGIMCPLELLRHVFKGNVCTFLLRVEI